MRTGGSIVPQEAESTTLSSSGACVTNHRLVSRLGSRRRGGEVVKLRRFRYARPGTIDRQVQFLNKEGFGRLRIRPLEERELPIGFQNPGELRRIATPFDGEVKRKEKVI
jgi:hypothetical protein